MAVRSSTISSVCLLFLLCWTEFLGTVQCSGSSRCGSKDIYPWNRWYNKNITLSVEAVVTSNASILLTCSGNTTQDQFLKWTEIGKQELPPAATASVNRYRLNVTSTTATEEVSTVLINNLATFAYYGLYTCQCYNNYSIDDVEVNRLSNDHELAAKYSRSCSEPFTVSALPSESVTITEHSFKSKHEHIEITCQNNGSQLLRVLGGSLSVIPSPPLIMTTLSPSSQGKYICLGENEDLEEIHYIVIPEYKPPFFLYPSLPTTAANSEHNFIIHNVPASPLVYICLVYSNEPIISMGAVTLHSGLFNEHIVTHFEVWSERILAVAMLKVYLPFFNYFKCFAETYWERVEQTYSIHLSPSPSVIAFHDVYLYIEVRPYPAIHNHSFTIRCQVYSSQLLNEPTFAIYHQVNNKPTQNRTQILQPVIINHLDSYYTTEYYVVIDRATEDTIGEYSCVVRDVRADCEWVESAMVHMTSIDTQQTADSAAAIPSSTPLLSSSTVYSNVLTNHHMTALNTPIIPPPSSSSSSSSYLRAGHDSRSISSSQHQLHQPTVIVSDPNRANRQSLMIIYIVAGVTAFIVFVSVIVLILVLCYARKLFMAERAANARQRMAAISERRGVQDNIYVMSRPV